MALNAAIQFEVRQGGSDTNSGGFKAGASGTDWSLQNTAQYAVSDGVTAGTTTITSATAAFGTDVVGNLVYVSGGTGSVAANWYEITVRNSATSITVDRSTGLTTGTGVTLNIGGAFATPGVFTTVSGGIGGQLVSGQTIWIKYNATDYVCSTSTAGPAGPMLVSALNIRIRGYDASRGDATGNLPSYKWTASAPGGITYLISQSGTAQVCFENLKANGNSVNNVGGFQTSTRGGTVGCIATGCSGTVGVGFNVNGSPGHAVQCLADTCLSGFTGSNSAVVHGCRATGCTTGFSGTISCIHCVATGGTTGYSTINMLNCISDSCSTNAFILSNGTTINCIASNCTGGTGFALGASIATMYNCAAYNNNANASGTPVSNLGPFASGSTLTSLGADPYVNQAGGDFRPNANSPGGAQLRAAGIGVYGQTDSEDIGAVQHTDPSGGNLIVCVEC